MNNNSRILTEGNKYHDLTNAPDEALYIHKMRIRLATVRSKAEIKPIASINIVRLREATAWHIEKARSGPDTGNLAPSEGLGRENHAAHFLRFSTCFGIGIVGCLRGVVGAGSLSCVARSVVDYVINYFMKGNF
jgi:hypothetical protein